MQHHNSATLYWHDYQYFPYERDLARREIEALIKPSKMYDSSKGLVIEVNISPEKEEQFKRLVYFAGYSFNGHRFSTLQEKLEYSCMISGGQKRQSTRYSVHGLHEYKGKFNPQVVRGILNVLGIAPHASVIDPFCGSGTTLVECAYGGHQASGCDINPLAVLISNAKLLALSTPAEVLRKHAGSIVSSFNEAGSVKRRNTSREAYLRHWFTPEIFKIIEKLRESIQREGGKYQNVFLVLASDLLRDYSLQEPADLRIRRRKSPLPDTPFMDKFQEKVSVFIENLQSAQETAGPIETQNTAYLTDVRSLGQRPRNWEVKPPYDAAITSPPYATALPYIDTQRLSLVWLGLVPKDELRILEANLTGSREFSGGQKSEAQEGLSSNARMLCPQIHDYCLTMKNALGKGDGFRRQSVPYLLYRYFSDMQEMFTNVLATLKPGAPFALVVGHNRTTLGGRTFDINTPELLKEAAVHVGWEHVESFPLQAYHRYSIHSKNAVNLETLLVLQKP